jgi:hypothetical protein
MSEHDTSVNRAKTELLRFLAEGRRRWRARAVVRGAVLGLAVAAASALVLFALAGMGLVPTDGRPLLRWIPLIALVGLPAAAVAVAILRAPADATLALRAEEVIPELEHIPTVLLELPTDHPYAPALTARAATVLERETPGRLVGPPFGRGAAIAAVLTVAIAVAVLARMGGPGAAWAAWSAEPAPARLATAPDAEAPPAPIAADPLANLSVRVIPPAYTGLPPSDHPADGVISAMAGSRLELSGPAGRDAAGLGVALVRGEQQPSSVPVDAAEGDGWSASWRLAMGDRGLVVSAGADADKRERVIPLAPTPDPAPIVELLEPTRDFVLATGTGEIAFRARARDPYGIHDFRLTWVHTRGSGESFDFREGEATWSTSERTADGVEGRLVLRLDDLELGPGEVLHLRAVATDANTVTGPGTGVSATRQIRVIREGDEMSVDALVGLPLELEQEPVLSQRMILLMTEELIARAPSLGEADFRREAGEIAGHQERLRNDVAEQIYSRATGAMEGIDTHLGHEIEVPHIEEEPPPAPSGSRYGVASIFDPSVEEEPPHEDPADHPPELHADDPDPAGTQVGARAIGGAGRLEGGAGTIDELGHAHDSNPVLSVNRPLLAIHDAMWQAERELRVIDPAASVPHQQDALARLQAMRENTRVFPRGRVTVPPVDVAAARGTGEVDDADPVARSAGKERPTAAVWIARVETLLRELDVPPEDPEAETLRDRLNTLAIELLGDPTVAPEVVGALARAADRRTVPDVAPGGPTAAIRSDLLTALDLLAPGASHRRSSPSGGWPSLPASALAAGPADPDDPAGPATRRTPATTPDPFVFATLRYESGNWDSAPLVPQNLIHSLALYTDLPVEPEGVVVDLSSLEIFNYPVLYLTGHLPVRFSAEEARNLERYVHRGGFVFMDDHNHDVDGAFHRTATAELERIFGAGALEPLPSDHEIYRAFFHFDDGPPTTSHELSGWGDGLIHPELFGVMVDGRIGVLYSNKDYSSEWSYHAVNKRFLGQDNTRFGVNVLLYALTR